MLPESGSSTSTAAANHQVEVASQDKRCRKSSKYHHHDVAMCMLKSLSLLVRKCQKRTPHYTQKTNYLAANLSGLVNNSRQ